MKIKTKSVVSVAVVSWLSCCCLSATLAATTRRVAVDDDRMGMADDNITRARRVAALMGAFVADAAAMPLHWIYDTDEIVSILANSNRTAQPEFFPTNKYCVFYDYPVGQFTPFGEQMAVYTHSLAVEGKVDPQASNRR